MAVYNGGFPASYQQYYPQYQQQYQPQVQQQNSGPIWIQGEAAAKSYLVAPGTTVALWDSESQTIYLKSADASGMPSMKILDYTIREAAQPMPKIASGDYVTREELQRFREEILETVRKEGKHESTLQSDE